MCKRKIGFNSKRCRLFITSRSLSRYTNTCCICINVESIYHLPFGGKLVVLKNKNGGPFNRASNFTHFSYKQITVSNFKRRTRNKGLVIKQGSKKMGPKKSSVNWSPKLNNPSELAAMALLDCTTIVHHCHLVDHIECQYITDVKNEQCYNSNVAIAKQYTDPVSTPPIGRKILVLHVKHNKFNQ